MFLWISLFCLIFVVFVAVIFLKKKTNFYIIILFLFFLFIFFICHFLLLFFLVGSDEPLYIYDTHKKGDGGVLQFRTCF